MQNLYNKLKKFSLKDAVFFEEKDRQFLALQKLYRNKKISDSVYLFLIITNSLVCYQLSWKWEDYWEEFWGALENKDFNSFEEIYNFFKDFLSNSKNNKRFVNIKLKRIKKLETFYKNFIWKEKYFYENMLELRNVLAKTMNQKKEAKTVVFAIKMFSYWARNIFQFREFPKEIFIPIDSRLENLYKKYSNLENINKDEIKRFYLDLSEKLNIPLLHLDAILWVNNENLIK